MMFHQDKLQGHMYHEQPHCQHPYGTPWCRFGQPCVRVRDGVVDFNWGLEVVFKPRRNIQFPHFGSKYLKALKSTRHSVDVLNTSKGFHSLFNELGSPI